MVKARWVDVKYKDASALYQAFKDGHRPRLGIDQHAAARYLEMRLGPDEVPDAIEKPEEIGFSSRHQCVLLSHGRITVSLLVELNGTPFIATILFRFQEDWEDAYKSGAAGSGSRYRRNLSHLKKREDVVDARLRP